MLLNRTNVQWIDSQYYFDVGALIKRECLLYLEDHLLQVYKHQQRTDRDYFTVKKDLTLVDGIAHHANHSFRRLIVLYHPVDEGEG